MLLDDCLITAKNLNKVICYGYFVTVRSLQIRSLLCVNEEFANKTDLKSAEQMALFTFYLYLLVTLDNIANLDIVVRLDVKTTILTYGNLLHIILETA